MTLPPGVDYVVHCAALSSPWGRYNDFYSANVEVTKNILEASVNNHVKKFVFISTPSIYFNFHDRFLVKESDPLPGKPVNYYAATKLLAEKHVLNANGNRIKTLALRPRAIVGAGDTVIFPRLLRAYHAGGLKIIGNGTNRCDLTCAGNVVEAIACSFNAGDEAFGRAFNISDGSPVILWQTINHLLHELELEPITKKIPESLAYFAARLIELKHKLLLDTSEPAITRYGLGALSKSLTMDISSARKYLNYQPIQTTEEGIKEFVEWYRSEK